MISKRWIVVYDKRDVFPASERFASLDLAMNARHNRPGTIYETRTVDGTEQMRKWAEGK